MTVQTVKLGRERFVLLREKDFRQLKARADSKSRPVVKPRRPSALDREDIALAKSRQSEPTRPYSQLRKELGLA